MRRGSIGISIINSNIAARVMATKKSAEDTTVVKMARRAKLNKVGAANANNAPAITAVNYPKTSTQLPLTSPNSAPVPRRNPETASTTHHQSRNPRNHPTSPI